MGKQKVALVLSMGGARGIAHIGVIEELLRHNYEITSIAGSSMGAMVGMLRENWKNAKNGCIVGISARCGNWQTSH